MTRALTVVAFIAYAAASVPLLASCVASDWPLELASHFLVHGALVLALLGACAFLLPRARIAVFGIVLALTHLLWIAPLYGSVDTSSHGAPVLRVVSVNLLYDNREHAQLTRWLERVRPDVLALVELTPDGRRSLATHLDAYAGQIEHVREDAFGIGLYARHSSLQRVPLAVVGPPQIAARLEHDSEPLTLFAVHTVPPMTRPGIRVRDYELRVLADAARDAGPRVVVAGDLNATSWSRAFRDTLDRGRLQDTRSGFGMQGTWRASWPALLRIPIDHVLIGSGLRTIRREVGPYVHSDHLPVLADVVLTRTR